MYTSARDLYVYYGGNKNSSGDEIANVSYVGPMSSNINTCHKHVALCIATDVGSTSA